ncbi:hypothetical protein [Pseudomonas sp. Marseille-P9655]|jgi:hypothetical protein|uniref:hypothetical protein n=1 Tax=Pseudomonas sp. Marseille-P9655 TaxID=2866591 RepID=UPI001CE4AB2C|nr:hypothetical protein [Pseudomonas sp. Marseille-P9655]
MPTVNRSSNTEIAAVLAPFAAVADCYDAAEEDSFQPAHDIGLHKDLALTLGQFRAVRTLLARPAPQPHPEPIAWMVGTAIWWTKEEAERDAAAMGLPVVTLGPCAGLDDHERLRTELVESDLAFVRAATEAEQLRAQLAERDVLLRDASYWLKREWAGFDDDLAKKIDAALSASAVPSAPTPQTINGHKLNCKAVDDHKPGDCSCGAEPDSKS